MIEPLIKALAYKLGYLPEDLDDIADSKNDGPAWAVSFDDLMCRIEEVNRDDELYVCCLIALGEVEHGMEVEMAQNCARRLASLPPLCAELRLSYSPNERIFYCYDIKKVDKLTEAKFSNFVRSCAQGSLKTVHPERYFPKLDFDEVDLESGRKILQDFLTDGSVDFKLLAQNLMRLSSGDAVALVLLNAADRQVTLSTRVCHHPSEDQLLESLALNPNLPLNHFISLRAGDLWFNSLLSPDTMDSKEVIYNVGLHFIRARELENEVNKMAPDPSSLPFGQVLIPV